MNHRRMKIVIGLYSMILFSGCVGGGGVSNGGQLNTYPFPSMEAEWIRTGEPIEFDGKLWYPQDGVENITDSEVFLMGEYRGVQFFVEKTDVKPYDRLYTKFGANRFRYFQVDPLTLCSKEDCPWNTMSSWQGLHNGSGIKK